MRANKKVLGSLEKCYALAPFFYDGKPHLVAAAEKRNACFSYTMDDQLADVLWTGPGGVMTMVHVPGTEILLATQQFYSPNDSAQAKLVYYRRMDEKWVCETLCDLPFVHRFGILERGKKKYLIACTLKSAHAYKDDWTCPGRVWAAPLPGDLTKYSADHQLELTPILNGMPKNHGFSKCTDADGHEFAVIGCACGAYRIDPPEKDSDEWQVEKMLDKPISDLLYLDFDGDGEREILTFSPFHGDRLMVWKRFDGQYQKVWQYETELPFLHAIWGENINGVVYAFVGNRGGGRELMALHYDSVRKDYVSELLDQGAGAANCLYLNVGGEHRLYAANRETDEIAEYILAL